ncbi:MAG: cardiolipin synthase [Bacteroidales bacterium]|nr:cardiolipin synthase [Bacteroidales bacterium]
MILTVSLSILFGLLLLGVVLVILLDDGDSGRKVAWLLVITVLPFVGLILYILIGINWRSHYIFNFRHRRSDALIKSQTTPQLEAFLDTDTDLSSIREGYRPFSRMLSRNYTRLTTGNALEIMTSGRRKLELLLEDLLTAKEYIHMEYFHFGNDEGSRAIREILMQKASQGVKVRFLYEAIGNFPIPGRYYYEMRKAGVEVVRFHQPLLHILNSIATINSRNHRKIVVIDGRIGYTGGMNINNHYFFKWRDTHLRLTGDAVAMLQSIFMDSWLTSGGSIDRLYPEYFPQIHAPSVGLFPTGGRIFKNKAVQVVADEPDAVWPIIKMSYEWVFANAKEYIYLQTPYFVPPHSVLEAMKMAALSGVDVRLMVPAKVDTFLMGPANRSFFGECLDAGIRIYEREGEFNHSKTFVADDYLSQIGSANMDNRSFDINYEVNSYIFDEEVALYNKGIFLKELENCREVTLEIWGKRRWYNLLAEKIMRLFAPVL